MGSILLPPFNSLIKAKAASAGALEFVGRAHAGQGGSTSDFTLDLTSLSGGIASAAAEDDIVVCAFGSGSINSASFALAGYTELCNIGASDSQNTVLQVGWKIMGATPDTVVNVTDRVGFNQSEMAFCEVWRGVDQTTPIDVATQTNTQINTQLPDPPAITPVTAGAQILVVAVGTHTSGSGEAYSASDLDYMNTDSQNSATDTLIGFGHVAWTSGAFNPAAWSSTVSDSANFSCCSATLALRPA